VGARQGPLSPRRGAEPLDLGGDEARSGLDVEHHELRVEPEDRVPRDGESPLTPRICRLPSRMIEAVDLDDEAHLGSEQVCDEPTKQRHLPTEGDTEGAAAERLEEPRFGRGGRVPHPGGVLGERGLS